MASAGIAASATVKGLGLAEPPPVGGRAMGRIGVGLGVVGAGQPASPAGHGGHVRSAGQGTGGGPTISCDSTAPMSQRATPSPLASQGRENPRWSFAGHPALSPASMAGLPPGMLCVWVGPPLSASGSRSGSTFERSLGPARLQVPSESRL